MSKISEDICITSDDKQSSAEEVRTIKREKCKVVELESVATEPKYVAKKPYKVIFLEIDNHF